MADEKFNYYIVFVIFNPVARMWEYGCRDIDCSGSLDEPERRQRLVAELAAGLFHPVVLVNWKRNS